MQVSAALLLLWSGQRSSRNSRIRIRPSKCCENPEVTKSKMILITLEHSHQIKKCFSRGALMNVTNFGIARFEKLFISYVEPSGVKTVGAFMSS